MIFYNINHNKMKHIYCVLALFCLSFPGFAYTQSFSKITTGAIVTDGGWSYGCCWADFNNDGYPDLGVLGMGTDGQAHLRIYPNHGGAALGFVASAPAAGVDSLPANYAAGDIVLPSGVPVSAVSPSLLLTEMEVEKTQKSQEKPPVLEPPAGDK